jgi:RNase P/RNase MRP subunit p30
MYDVVNLATLFGMTEKAARAAMTTNAHAMLAMCKRRRDAGATESVVFERVDAST